MEVYGNIDCSDGHRVTEEEQGYVDPLAPRSCYPLGKRMAENLCALYYSEYGAHALLNEAGRSWLAADEGFEADVSGYDGGLEIYLMASFLFWVEVQ